MLEKKCDECGAMATVQLNLYRYLCSQHAYEAIMCIKGEPARKMQLKLVTESHTDG